MMADQATRSAASNADDHTPANPRNASQRTRGGNGGHSHRGRGRGPRPARAASTTQNEVPSADSASPGPGQGRATTAAAAVPTGADRAGANRRRFRRGGSDTRGRGSSTAASAGAGPLGGRGALRRGAGGHVFGGQLTRERVEAASGSALQGDAPEFVPAAAVPRRDSATTTASSLAPLTRKDSSLRSSAPDIATRTHQDIANGLYECSICTNDIRSNSKVWTCTLCWTVFHLSCIKKWSTNQGSTLAPVGPVDEDDPAPRRWRCPGCNLAKDALPSVYACWCGKEVEPKPVSGVPPHSCGQTCAKPRSLPKQCPHPCELTCHAGPCPPCAYMGPVQSCFCGKEAFARRCIETNYVEGWSCGKPCGDVMPCGEHTCLRPCHEGLCGACEVLVESTCFCGKAQKTILCTDRQEPKQSQKPANRDTDSPSQAWYGVFNCGVLCERSFDCGKHVCEKTCHPQDAASAHCPRSPDTVTHCPCGKTALEKISDDKRQNCEDPIPNCDQSCLKKLSCGHLCQKTCHLGSCPPCTQVVNVTCRCGRVTNQMKCHQRTSDIPICTRSCKATLNCGRHECGEQCCPGEKQAQERLAQKKKPRPLNAAPRAVEENFEAEHICTRVCGRPLKCGNHQCPELCHKGPCASCREAIFEEIACHCGKTILHPPLPCGTGPPPCRFPCERPKPCGHPAVQHNCHGDQEPCPSCPYLVEKVCLCKRKTLKNQPCFRTEVMCGEVCGKRLKCGSHSCQKSCHRPGECEDASVRCQQPCGDPKKACGHPCEERCHNPSACKEDRPCESKIIVTCDCQNRKSEMRCLASRNSAGNKKKRLECNDDCGLLERNRKLALALNIDPDHQDSFVPYSNLTLQMYQDDTQWAQAQEKELRLFAADDSQRRLRCKPMPNPRRAFLHALAEDFGLDSESVDPEPHRHVFLFKTPRFVKAPMKTLAECVRIRSAPPQGMATPARGEEAKLAVDNEPFNGFLLTAPRFALTLEEIRTEIAPAVVQAKTLTFDVEFLPSEEIVLRARPSNPNTTIAPLALETHLRSLRPAFLTAIGAKKLAGTIALCALDPSLNLLRRETSDASVSSGWNRVAARAASAKAPLRATGPAAVGQRSTFTILSKKREMEKQKQLANEEVADDWEEEMRKEEEKELQLSDGHSDRDGESHPSGSGLEHGVKQALDPTPGADPRGDGTANEGARESTALPTEAA